MVTVNNWNYSYFENGEHRAIVSFGASPELLDDEFVYYVTVLDQDDNEIYQQEFTEVANACTFMNQKYGDFWDFKDMSQKNTSGGCGSCVAH